MTRHPTDLVSLTFGMLFGALGVVLLLGRLDGLNVDWVIPAAIVVLGVLLIVLARSIGRRREDEPTEP
jgi:uncharacterized protein YacL